MGMANKPTPAQMLGYGKKNLEYCGELFSIKIK